MFRKSIRAFFAVVTSRLDAAKENFTVIHTVFLFKKALPNFLRESLWK